MLSKTLNLYKKAYSNHPKEVWDLVIITIINRLGMMVLPFLTVYLTTRLGYPLKQAGWLAGAYGFGSFAGAYIGGKLSDRIGAKIVIFCSLFISGVFLICLQFVSTFYPIFIIIFMAALFGESFRPAMMVVIGSIVEKSQTGRSMAFIRLAVNVGMTASPLIGGIIIASLDYVWLFWIDGLTCLIAAFYFIYASSTWNEKIKKEKENNVTLNVVESDLPPYKNIKYLGFLFATFLASFAFVQWFNSIPVFIKTVWHFDERYIGTLLGLNSFLIVAIEMPAIDTVEKAKVKKIAMLAGIFLISISFLPFLFSKALFYCFISMILFTLGEILLLPLNNSTALNMSPASLRGSYVSWYWMTWSAALILGPMVGLGIADYFGFSVFWIVLVLISMVSFFMHYKLVEN